ncbi:MAG: hypothetical protein K0U52_12060 [Gammaproteobacteria bacterium]|nr:hypothetical protein [Gammaproteobacteria bacterium]
MGGKGSRHRYALELKGGALKDDKQLIWTTYMDMLNGKVPDNPRHIIRVGQAGKSLKEAGQLTIGYCSMVKNMMDAWMKASVGRPVIQMAAPFWQQFDCQSLWTPDDVQDMEDDEEEDLCPICHTEQATCQLGYRDDDTGEVAISGSRVCPDCVQQMCNQMAQTSWVDEDTGEYWNLGAIACKDPLTGVPVNVYKCLTDSEWQLIPVPEESETDRYDSAAEFSGMEDEVDVDRTFDPEPVYEIFRLFPRDTTSIIVPSDNISGLIPIDIVGRFRELKTLIIHPNDLRGEIPQSLYSRRRLTRLIIVSNPLEARLDSDLGMLTSLTELTLKDCKIHGSIPDSFGQLSLLEILDLSQNDLTGLINPVLNNLTQLKKLDLTGNSLSGSVPDLGQLQNLEFLGLDQNYLTGHIPYSIGQLNNLLVLGLSQNQLNGDLPSSMGEMHNLQVLTLAFNQLSGSVASLFTLRNLVVLNINNNNFSGNLDEELEDERIGTAFQKVSLQRNDFTGIIPDKFQYMTQLQKLRLDHNDFDGNVPGFLSELPLEVLTLKDNRFYMIPRHVVDKVYARFNIDPEVRVQ